MGFHPHRVQILNDRSAIEQSQHGGDLRCLQQGAGAVHDSPRNQCISIPILGTRVLNGQDELACGNSCGISFSGHTTPV